MVTESVYSVSDTIPVLSLVQQLGAGTECKECLESVARLEVDSLKSAISFYQWALGITFGFISLSALGFFVAYYRGFKKSVGKTAKKYLENAIKVGELNGALSIMVSEHIGSNEFKDERDKIVETQFIPVIKKEVDTKYANELIALNTATRRNIAHSTAITYRLMKTLFEEGSLNLERFLDMSIRFIGMAGMLDESYGSLPYELLSYLVKIEDQIKEDGRPEISRLIVEFDKTVNEVVIKNREKDTIVSMHAIFRNVYHEILSAKNDT